MKIKIFWDCGIIERWEAEKYYGSDKDKVVATGHVLRLDDLEQNGLSVDVHWQNAALNKVVPVEVLFDGQTVKMERTRIQRGYTILLVEPRQIPSIVRIDVDGVKAVWRYGKHLINGIVFYALQERYLGENPGSFNSNAVELYAKIKSIYPKIEDREIAAMMGIPYKAWLDIQMSELCEDEDSVSEVEVEPSYMPGRDSELEEGEKGVSEPELDLTAALQNLLDDK